MPLRGDLRRSRARCRLAGKGEHLRRLGPKCPFPDQHEGRIARYLACRGHGQALFGEGPGGIVVSGRREALLELSHRAARVGFLALGQVGGQDVRIVAADARIDLSVEAAGGLFDPGLTDRVS